MLLNSLLSVILEIGSFGYTVAIVGWMIVFVALVLLYMVFMYIPKLLNIKLRNRLRKQGKGKKEIENSEIEISGEVNAAISAALFLYFNELHDDESNVLTIKKISRVYSPWSSKIYGVGNRIHRN